MRQTSTLDPAIDGPRIATQLAAVRFLMRDGEWRTLKEIARFASCSEAGASARLRDLRKLKHGGFEVDRRRVPHVPGLHEYRVTPPDLFTPKPSPKSNVAELRAALSEAHEALARAHQALRDAGLPLPGEGE